MLVHEIFGSRAAIAREKHGPGAKIFPELVQKQRDNGP